MRRLALLSMLIGVLVAGVVVGTSEGQTAAALAVGPVAASSVHSPLTDAALVSLARPKPTAGDVAGRPRPAAQSRRSAVAGPVAHVVAVPRPVENRPPAPAPHPAAAPQSPPAGGCAAALAYLATHAAPGFTVECPGNAFGHQAMTCINVSGMCSGQKVIAIAVACPASWMNEASNSWVLSGLARRSIDPYGYCS